MAKKTEEFRRDAVSMALTSVVLSRLRSGPPTHLCDLSLKSQGAFAT